MKSPARILTEAHDLVVVLKITNDDLIRFEFCKWSKPSFLLRPKAFVRVFEKLRISRSAVKFLELDDGDSQFSFAARGCEFFTIVLATQLPELQRELDSPELMALPPQNGPRLSTRKYATLPRLTFVDSKVSS